MASSAVWYPEPELLERAGVDGRLRDGLPVPDRERAVLVGAVRDAGRDEGVARYEVERAKDGEVGDPVRLERLDEATPRAAELLPYGARHQLSDAVSMS